jgi:hypothetical protein
MVSFSLYEGGIFKVIPKKEINLNEFLELIKQDNPLIEKIRKIKDKAGRDKLKSNLSYVTFGGTFTRRANKCLIKGSGLASFDLDGIENLEELKQKVISNKYTHCVFVSPSGNGFKLLVKIPEVKDDEEYKQYWNSIAEHYNFQENDEGTKDVARACYLSVDKEPYLNPKSEIYTEKKEDILLKKGKENISIRKGEQPGATLSTIDKDERHNTRKEIAKDNSFLDKLKSAVSMESVLNHFGVDITRNPTDCPFHVCSQRCLSFNSDTAHCFDTDCNGDNSWNIFSFVKKIKNYNSAEAINWLVEFAGMQEEQQKAREKYLNSFQEPKGWACSINIRKFAERHNLLQCPVCNQDLEFNELLGSFKCPCGLKGGLKDFAKLILQTKQEQEIKC